jgi:hypothetical protein
LVKNTNNPAAVNIDVRHPSPGPPEQQQRHLAAGTDAARVTQCCGTRQQ